ncbi:hypothetical protein [Plasmodium yoelii yoelii]|uniref:Uncharacterized protein n=1 Tax=Plasmodium yoelii yoelii TaxID=73239 RepID=Q7RQJ3_PLAYO|nr:hypothetical protein [Plasmodium yoelii yoelii]
MYIYKLKYIGIKIMLLDSLK